FAESALLHFQQNNVNINDFCAGACLASAKNYLVKVVRNRPLGEKVAFQGAVAFNRGMVGAFETLLDRLIIVPPYPHLTGAIGAAQVWGQVLHYHFSCFSSTLLTALLTVV
ncbi:hypothetical protein HKBW3S33_02158, partial [Candidatus Hakubella thermalkaliphila]